MPESLMHFLPDTAATTRLGGALARAITTAKPRRLVLFLTGGLGAGKTALTRAVLAALGHPGRVPSPTYTLVEPYAVPGYRLVHVDLYRLEALTDVDDLALADYLAEDADIGNVLVVEWPGRGAGRLPEPDIRCHLQVSGQGGREVAFEGMSRTGGIVVDALRQQLGGAI